MNVAYEISRGAHGFTTVEVDVADVLTLAMTQDPRLLAALITDKMRTEHLTLRTQLTDSQKEYLREVVEVITHV